MQPEEKSKNSNRILAPEMEDMILFFANKFSGKMDRVLLCKYLYYSDGHFFQKKGTTISTIPYMHIEGSPVPMFFNEIMHQMVREKKVSVTPNIETKKGKDGPMVVLKGLAYKALVPPNGHLSKEQKRVLSSIASTLGGDLSLETRYYPNLYQQYAQTGLYETIPFERLPGGTRPHLSWKSWGRKIFNLRWE